MSRTLGNLLITITSFVITAVAPMPAFALGTSPFEATEGLVLGIPRDQAIAALMRNTSFYQVTYDLFQIKPSTDLWTVKLRTDDKDRVYSVKYFTPEYAHISTVFLRYYLRLRGRYGAPTSWHYGFYDEREQACTWEQALHHLEAGRAWILVTWKRPGFQTTLVTRTGGIEVELSPTSDGWRLASAGTARARSAAPRRTAKVNTPPYASRARLSQPRPSATSQPIQARPPKRTIAPQPQPSSSDPPEDVATSDQTNPLAEEVLYSTRPRAKELPDRLAPQEPIGTPEPSNSQEEFEPSPTPSPTRPTVTRKNRVDGHSGFRYYLSSLPLAARLNRFDSTGGFISQDPNAMNSLAHGVGWSSGAATGPSQSNFSLGLNFLPLANTTGLIGEAGVRLGARDGICIADAFWLGILRQPAVLRTSTGYATENADDLAAAFSLSIGIQTHLGPLAVFAEGGPYFTYLRPMYANPLGRRVNDIGSSGWLMWRAGATYEL